MESKPGVSPFGFLAIQGRCIPSGVTVILQPGKSSNRIPKYLTGSSTKNGGALKINRTNRGKRGNWSQSKRKIPLPVDSEKKEKSELVISF
jgi:hypothetical protein